MLSTMHALRRAAPLARRSIGVSAALVGNATRTQCLPIRQKSTASASTKDKTHRHERKSAAKKEIPSQATKIQVSPPNTRRGPITVAWTNEFLYLTDKAENGSKSFHATTLRDSCACPKCKDPASGQKSFASIQVPVDIGIESVRATDEGLAITFTNDMEAYLRDGGHEMTLPWETIELNLRHISLSEMSVPRRNAIQRRTGVEYWDREVIAREVRRIDYNDYMAEGEAFWDAVVDICRLGIVYIKNVPRDEDSVVRITTRMANIRETFYGRTFDVRAKPDAENVAYTSGYLGLHQDLLYLEPPPMIQVLHCMDNSCHGGESLFSDGERVGRLLWPFAQNSAGVEALRTLKVPYQYNKHGYHYYSRRNVLNGHHFGNDSASEFHGVYWSPPFQGRYTSGSQDLREWIPAARIFEQLINDERAVHKQKMEPGECVLFDNLRVMHGRTAFDAAGGSRWLRGAYIAAEDFLSRASKIPEGQAEKYRGEQPWTPELAHTRLKKSWWHEEASSKIKDMDARATSHG